MRTEQTTARSPAAFLDNAALRLEFDRAAGGLRSIVNKLTNETYAVTGDAFAVETTAFRRTQAELRQLEWTATAKSVTARYADADLTVEVAYELRPGEHFFQKRLAVTFVAAGGVRQLTLGQPAFTLAGLDMVCYRHPDFDWVTEYVATKHGGGRSRPPDSEPARTFFGRTAKGGFFTGVEMAYDNSRLEKGALTLGYSPNLKVKAGERLDCENVYFGVYRRDGCDARAADWAPLPAAQVVGNDAHSGFDGAAAAGLSATDTNRNTVSVPAAAKVLPLPSESAAMTAMTSAILGPPRHGVMAFACGWHSQMEQDDYDGEEKLAGDLRSMEFLAGCGLDGLSGCQPWCGEARKMAALREGERYEHGEYARRFLERARALKLKVIQWPTMNNTHPWRPHGVPFRKDRPEWLRGIPPTCALVYVPFTCEKAGPATFGFGADWWYEAWLDGTLISETLQSGNATFPVGVANHTVTVDVAAGKHVLALRAIRGSASAVVAMGGPRDVACAGEASREPSAANRSDCPGQDAVVLPSGCVVFAPFDKWAGAPPPERLREVPAVLELGGRRVEGRPAVFDANRILDLAPFLGEKAAEPDGSVATKSLNRCEANCIACAPFYDWLEKLILDDTLGKGLYEGWAMDGDFWGTGAYFHTTLPVTCLAENHEHLPGDSNYACQRRLDRLIAEVRRRHPGMYIAMCRPPMDLGVWANRHVDAVFTLIESGTGGSNLAAGDEVRTASRIRVQHHFFPHWMDWSLLFPSYAGAPYPKWPEGHLDYLLLSALSCSPNLLLYLPTKTGIPDKDKAEIKKWLDWGRKNIAYLHARKDLFDWPGKGKVDGSAHIVGDAGLIFLFNPNEKPMTGEFALTGESIGLKGEGAFAITQEHPAPGRAQTARAGETVRWEVPAKTAMILRVGPAGS